MPSFLLFFITTTFILHQDMGYHDKTVINICHPHDDGDHLARSIII